MDKMDHNRTLPLTFRMGDLIAVLDIAALALLLGVVFWIPGRANDALTVEIRQSGELIAAYPLSEDRTVTVGGDYDTVIVIRSGTVWVESSSCPGADCIHRGKISAAGRSIVCLPNRVEIRLVGAAPGDVDIAVG